MGHKLRSHKQSTITKQRNFNLIPGQSYCSETKDNDVGKRSMLFRATEGNLVNFFIPIAAKVNVAYFTIKITATHACK